jgi:hypothetical protein
MYNGGSLAATGATVTVLGHTFGLSWIVSGAVGAVIAGVLLYRIGSRKQRYEQA